MAWAPERVWDAAQETSPPIRSPGPRSGLAQYRAASQLQVLRSLDTTRRGLTEDEAEARLARCGENAIAAARLPKPAARIRTAVRNPFIAILICLAAVSAATGALGGAAVIATLAAISCLLRVSQESRSDRAAAALRAMVATTTTVIRRPAASHPGVARELPVDQLVPGDIVRLCPGDMVPADLRLLRSDELTVSQSVFTGESLPAVKQAGSAVITEPGPADQDGAVLDCPVLCFMGTGVLSGSGTAVVIATGASTYLGSSQNLASSGTAGTSFDRTARRVSWLLTGIMAICVPVVLAVNAAIRGHPLEAFLFAVAVAVGLTPEMLPVVVTTALARGAAALAGHAAIIKRLPAIYNLGAMDVLCTDKTGTLTEDRPAVDCAVDSLGQPDPDVLRLACASSRWSAESQAPAVTDVLDQALLAHAAEAGLTGNEAEVLVGLVPFDPGRRRVTVVLSRPGELGRHLLITKGSARDVIDCCDYVRTGGQDVPIDHGERARVIARSQEYARAGLRVLAVATATRNARPGGYRPADEAGMTLVGFLGFRDPPRSTAPAALAALAGQGITVKVVTGDHPLVAARICRDVGIEAGQPVTGLDVDRLDEAELRDLAASTTIFARVGPAQKARIVRALRAGGRTVGFLGDGLNDTAALREADVGISVSGAAAAARECADVILLRADLSVLSDAVARGRRTFGNIVKYLKITVSSNFGNALSMVAASAVLPFLPMLPTQVLVQNLCFDLSQLPLAFDTVDESSIRTPRTFDARDLARFAAWFGPVNMLADLATFVILWRLIGQHDSPAGQVLFRSGWFAENLLTQAAAIHLLRSRWLPSVRRHAARPVLLGTLALAVAGLAVPFTPLAPVIQLGHLPEVYVPLLAVVLAGYCAVTIGLKACYIARAGRWL
ncbi:MAG TPA: magnesium-translocating P-type ATPase [Streptosporangiaceae bacterium]|nr:magnesium-translocating P-type ATPase [Streptosporangiaceae bacterium]